MTLDEERKNSEGLSRATKTKTWITRKMKIELSIWTGNISLREGGS